MCTVSWDRFAILAQAEQPSSGPADLVVPVIYFALVVLALVGAWKTFAKAGQPGWGVIIPFYNLYLLCKIAGRPGWWFLLFFIPLVNLIIMIIVFIDVAKNFGKGLGFGLGLVFLGFIFFPILGFGDARYLGNKA
jgi:Family of unknown function (DUF5684)